MRLDLGVEEVNIVSRFRDGKLEKKFREYNMKGELEFLKWIALVSGLFNVFFLLHDFYYIPDHTKLIITISLRVMYFLWTCIFFIFCKRLKDYGTLYKMKSFTEILFMYTQIQILYILKFQNFDSHSLIILIIYIGFAVISIDWIYFTLSIILYTFAYFFTCSLYLVDYTYKEYVTAGVYFLLAIILCSLASYQSCMHKRLVFYKNILDEHIRCVERERALLLENEKQKAITLLEQEQMISKINKMAFLRSQIKPHFIYNALNTIEQFCYEAPEKAGELIMHLSSYLCYCFDFDQKEQVVSFENELELIHAYIEIEKARFSDRFYMEYDLCDTTLLKIPPLSIQPLIENAVKHAVGRKGRQDLILLQIVRNEEFYQILVQDNGIGITRDKLDHMFCEDSQKDGVGLNNINSRLMELYEEKLEIVSEQNVGTKISFRIPISVDDC